MIQPAPLPLAGNRWTPFVHVIEVAGADLSAATFKAQVRLYPDAPDAALVTLNNASLGAEGINCSVATVDGETISTVTMRVNETTMEGMPGAAEVGRDTLLYWDMHVTRSGYSKAVYFAGTFTVRAGVTQ